MGTAGRAVTRQAIISPGTAKSLSQAHSGLSALDSEAWEKGSPEASGHTLDSDNDLPGGHGGLLHPALIGCCVRYLQIQEVDGGIILAGV